MANTNIKAPKLNISNIKSPLSGGGSGLGRVGQGGTSKIGTLARIARKNKIAINSLELQKEESINSSLMETNRILVEIQKQLALDFAMRASEDKEEKNKLQREDSKKKLKAEESALEKTGKKIGKAVGKVTSKILAPVKGIFDKVLDFIITLGSGIAVNAVFEWLKDENNLKKVEGWFSWIKENWQWIAAAVGAIALLPLIGTITTVITTLGSIVGLAGPLFAFLANPVTLTVLGTLAAVAAGTFALGKAAEWGIDKVQKATYGEGNVKKGIFITRLLDNYGRISSQKDRDKMTDEEKSTATFLYQYDQMLKDRQTTNDQLYRAKEQLKLHGDKYGSTDIDKGKIAELEKKLAGQDSSISMAETQGIKVEGKNLQELFNIYSTTGALPTTSISSVPALAKGGPVSAGKPYLVGEEGPELIVPKISGTVVNNMKTERIYQMISSDMGEGNINMMELQPITNQLPPPEIPVPSGPATEVPDVSSVNLADPYRQLTPMLYGITV